MAAKGDTSSFQMRDREFLLQIEAKVRKWWEDEKVFSAECEKPGDKFFGKFPFDRFMGKPFSLSKLECLSDIPIDAMRFALVYVCDGAVDEGKINFLHSNADSVYHAANTAILKIKEEMSWHEEFLAADFDFSLRYGLPTTFADRVFTNEINIALNRTKEQYEAGQFRGALDSIFELQDARDWYKISCGDTTEMNRDLVWRFMNVQTCLITPICPHYAEYVWRDLLYNMDFVVNAEWPVADAQDESILQSANKYLKDLIDSMKRQAESERNKKGTAPATTRLTEESHKLEAHIYVNEADDTFTFATEALHSDYRQNGNELKQNGIVKFGGQYIHLKLPFREEVLLQNLDFIKREIGLDKVRVVSATNPHDLVKAGSPVELLDAESSSPGNPANLSMTWPENDFRSFGTSKTTPLLVDLFSSGSALKHFDPLKMLGAKPKSKVPQKFSHGEEYYPKDLLLRNCHYPEELSLREKYYPEKCHGNPASLYRPPSKLLFQGSFDKALDTACNEDKWLLVNMQCLDNFSSHMEYFDTPEGNMVSTKYVLDSSTIVLLIDPMTGEAMCSWNGMFDPNDFMMDLQPYLVTSPKNTCVRQEEKELLWHTSQSELETSRGSTSKAKLD